MTGESGESGSGYEHAGGYKPAWELPTLREVIPPLIFAVIAGAGERLLDKYLGRHTHGHFTLFAMLVGSIFMLVVASLIIRGGRPGAREGEADPVSGVDPEEADADPARQRRGNLLWAVFLIIVSVSLAMFAYALSELMSAGATP